MATGFFHGIDTRYVDTVPRPVRVVPSAAVFIVGTAPTFKVDAANRTINEPLQLLSDVDDALWIGGKSDGFTLPSALDALRDHEAYYVDVVNVFDAATHKTTAQAISYTFTADSNSIQLQQVTGTAPSQTKVANTKAEGLTGTFTVTGPSATPSYALNTDYTYDATTGVLTRVTSGSIGSTATVEVTYTYADPSLVDADDIIGTVDVNGNRTGLQLALDIFNLRGYKSKIIICPGFSELAGVATEMAVVAEKLDAVCLIDASEGATRSEVIAGRNGTAPESQFGASDSRVILCFPRVYNSAGELEPLSQRAAGVMAQTDAESGYWWSPSNKLIRGITGAEVRLTADFTNPSTEVNSLNEVGIVTVYQSFGTGLLLWGNRTSLYPSDTTPLNFIPVRRTLDIFHESLQRASLPYLDRPINDALIDAITAAGNNFVREQVILGALIEGSRVFYDPANNPPSQLAAGRLTFNVNLMIPTPAETIIYESTLDINLLANVGASQQEA